MKLKKNNLKVFTRFLNKTYRYLTPRPHSEQEVVDYLTRKKADSDLINQIIDKLKSLQLLNDLEFSHWWIEQRAVFRPKGKRVLKLELKQKGISSDMIDTVLTGLDELGLARKLAIKKQLPKERMIPYLARRGFTWSTIKKALEVGDHS